MDISAALDTHDFMLATGSSAQRAFESGTATLATESDIPMSDARKLLRTALAERGPTLNYEEPVNV